MNYKSSLRCYKISKLLNKPIDKKFEKIYQHVKTNMIGLKEYKHKFNPSLIFYIKDKKYLIERDIINNYFWIDYRIIWIFFESIYNNKELITDLIRQIIEHHYKVKNPLVSEFLSEYDF